MDKAKHPAEFQGCFDDCAHDCAGPFGGQCPNRAKLHSARLSAILTAMLCIGIVVTAAVILKYDRKETVAARIVPYKNCYVWTDGHMTCRAVP